MEIKYRVSYYIVGEMMHHLIVPIELKHFLCHNKKQSFVSFPEWHNHTPHSWQYHWCHIFSSADSSKCSDLDCPVLEMLR